MAFYRGDYVKVKQKFEQRRVDARNRMEERRKEVCAAVPELKEICGLLDDTGPRVYQAALEGKAGFEEKLAAIRRQNDALLQRQSELLVKNGYPADYLDVKYECPLCRDEGNIDGRMCGCMKAELAFLGFETAGIAALRRKMNFGSFDLSYYKDGDRKNMEVVLRRIKEYAENFHGKGSGSLLFIGGTGLGKTHLSVALTEKVVENGYYAVYCTAENLFSDFRYERFRREDDKTDSKTDRYYDCELLVIDDLGTELGGRDITPFLYNLLNVRINSGLSTVINTNLSHNEMMARYDERIASRLLGEFLPYRFTGKDVRMQKLQQM